MTKSEKNYILDKNFMHVLIRRRMQDIESDRSLMSTNLGRNINVSFTNNSNVSIESMVFIFYSDEIAIGVKKAL
jgi:hypothetical protein